METVKRNYGKISKGHRIPYGTMVGVDPEIRLAYYSNGYKEDSMLPELPCPPIDSEYVDPEEELHKKEMVGVVQEAIETLSPRAAKVLCLRFGIGLTQDYTLEEVGRTFEVTRERIRQIECKAFRDLKHPNRSEKHLKAEQPEMYQELKGMVEDIWGHNADKVWEMYAEKK